MADLSSILNEVDKQILGANLPENEGTNHDKVTEGDVTADATRESDDVVGTHSRIPEALARAVQQRKLVVAECDESYVDSGSQEGVGDDDKVFSGKGRQDNGDTERITKQREGFSELNDGERSRNQDYELLKYLWSSELTCPELLPNNFDTIELLVEVLLGQEDTIRNLFQQSDHCEKQPPLYHGARQDGSSMELASLMTQIVRMDFSRTRFLLVDLARARMAKIENHALYNRTFADRMSYEEASYLRQYGELLERHYRRSALNHLPKEAWKKLDETDMVDSPSLEEFVFCRVLETVQIDIRNDPNIAKGEMSYDVYNEDNYGETLQEHHEGSCLIVMYRTVRNLVLEGKVELLL